MLASLTLAGFGALSIATGAATIPVHRFFLHRAIRLPAATAKPRLRDPGEAHVRPLRTVATPAVVAQRRAVGLPAMGRPPVPPATPAWRTPGDSAA